MSAQHFKTDQDPDCIGNELGDSHPPISETIPEEPGGRHSESDLQLVRVDGNPSLRRTFYRLIRSGWTNTVITSEGVFEDQCHPQGFTHDTVEHGGVGHSRWQTDPEE